MYGYRAFGLNIESNVFIPHLIPRNLGEVDVYVEKQEDLDENDFLKRRVEEQGKKFPWGWITPSSFYLKVKNVGAYIVQQGKYITIIPEDKAPLQTVNLYLLGSAMGALFFQRRILPLHGSLVCLSLHRKEQEKKEGILLTGLSGAGKSTIAACLCRQGAKILTDDIAVIDVKENGLFVQSSYPSCKLWEDALSRMNLKDCINPDQNPKALHRIVDDMDKYEIDNREYFYEAPVPLKRIIEIMPRDGAKVSCEEIRGGQKLALISQNIYRRSFAEAMGLQEWLFSKSINIGKQIETYRIFRPIEKGFEEEITALIGKIHQLSLK